MYLNHTTSRSAGCFTSLATTPAHKVNVVIIAPETEGLHGLMLRQNVQFMAVALSALKVAHYYAGAMYGVEEQLMVLRIKSKSIKLGRNNILAFCIKRV